MMSNKYMHIIVVVIIVISIITICLSLIGCKNTNNLSEMRIGKSFNIVIKNDEIIDAEILEKIAKEEIAMPGAQFYLLNKDAFQNLVKYMKENNYTIAPGSYTINQAWGFEDGLFIINKLDENGKVQNEKMEVLKFVKKPLD